MLRNYFLIFFIIVAALSFYNKRAPDFSSYIIDSDLGIDPQKLDLIEHGPPGIQINYFPKDVMHDARVKICKVFDIDSATETLRREVQFNYSGDIIKDSKYYFQDWNFGTTVGTSLIIYDSLGRLIFRKAGNFGRGIDRRAIVRHYTKGGLLFAEDNYIYKRHLRKGADPHLTSPIDFELQPSWRLNYTKKYFTAGDTLIIETRDRKKILDTEKFLLEFDSLERLMKKYEIQEGYLFDTTVYFYAENSVTAELARRRSDDEETFKHVMRSELNESGQILRKETVSDGIAGAEIIITYNSNRTIHTVRKGESLQRFEYSYY